MNDHYRTLGVAPNAEDVVIRAAYLALMRRYHPDQNRADEAAEQAKRISAAYGVLSDPARREAYDRKLAQNAVPLSYAPVKAAPRGRNASAVMLVVALGLLTFAYTRPEKILSDSPAPSSRVVAKQAAAEPRPAACPTRIDGAELRRALFRDAEAMPAVNSSAFRQAAASASVEVIVVASEGSEGLGSLRCRASVSLRLPDGIVTAGGSSTLLTDLWFRPDGTPAGSPLSIEADDALTRALLTLASADPVPDIPALPTEPRQIPPPALPKLAAEPRQSIPKPQPIREQPSPRARPAPAPSPPREPSVNLAALDRHGTLLYQQSYLAADARKRELLVSSRVSFLSRLGNCSSDRCRRDQLLRRNQEIAAIMRE